MNERLTRILVAVSALTAWGFLAGVGCEQNAGQPPAPAELTAQPAAEPADTPVSNEQPSTEAAGEDAPVPEKTLEPITGAFGVTLGERFEPTMVAEVLGEEERRYMKADRSTGKATFFRIVPKTPDEHYTQYSATTNEGGLVYMIEGEFVPAEKGSTCEVAERLVGDLREKYGKPVGADMHGTAFAFRDTVQNPSREVKLSLNRCGFGHYRITYYDYSLLSDEDEPEATEEEVERVNAEAAAETAPAAAGTANE